jgi:hypothetical protein
VIASRIWRGGVLAATVGAVSACTPPPPVDLSPVFIPPSNPPWSASKNWPGGHPSCRVQLASVTDLRADPQAMGDIGGRLVHSSDTRGWVESGLRTLSLDPRFVFVDSAAGADIVVNAELVNAYMLSITMDKSVSVVLRVRYAPQGKPVSEQVYRGVDTGTNWNSASGETQGAFDRALAQVIALVDADIDNRCVGG